jgi:hypothetical protein
VVDLEIEDTCWRYLCGEMLAFGRPADAIAKKESRNPLPRSPFSDGESGESQ